MKWAKVFSLGFFSGVTDMAKRITELHRGAGMAAEAILRFGGGYLFVACCLVVVEQIDIE